MYYDSICFHITLHCIISVGLPEVRLVVAPLLEVREAGLRPRDPVV